MSIEVKTINELKEAMCSDENEIITYDEDLVNKLKAIKIVKDWGPLAIGGIVAAVPLLLATGPVGVATFSGVMAVAAPATAATTTITTTTIIALVIAIGGTIAISLFTDWDYVDLPLGIKMRRRQ